MLVTLPIPESLWESLTEFVRPPWGDTLWKSFLLVALFLIGTFLAQLGGVWFVLVFVIVYAVARDELTQWVVDLWNRNWATT